MYGMFFSVIFALSFLFSFFFPLVTEKMKKLVLMQKQMILTSEQRADHRLLVEIHNTRGFHCSILFHNLFKETFF